MNATKTLLAVMVVLFGMTLSASELRAQDDAALADAAVDPTLTAAAAQPVQTVEPADVLKLVQSRKADFALVDTQPADGYAAGHIPGAISYPWTMQIKSFPIPLPRDKMLVFYGSCPNDTSDMVKKLAQFGYFNVKIMEGGWYKWQELHYPAAGTDTNSAPDLSQLASPSSKTGVGVSR